MSVPVSNLTEINHASRQLGPGGSCDSQTDSQTPWADDSFTASLKHDVDEECRTGMSTAGPVAEVEGKPPTATLHKPLIRRVTGPLQGMFSALADMAIICSLPAERSSSGSVPEIPTGNAAAPVQRPLVCRMTVCSCNPVVSAAGEDTAIVSAQYDAGQVDSLKIEQHGSEADKEESQREHDNGEGTQGFGSYCDKVSFI